MSAQSTHERLIATLASLKEYQYEGGKPMFRLRKEMVSGYKPENFTDDEVQLAGKLIADLFNLTGGSVTGFNLYKLFHAYFKEPEKREEINKIIKP